MNCVKRNIDRKDVMGFDLRGGIVFWLLWRQRAQIYTLQEQLITNHIPHSPICTHLHALLVIMPPIPLACSTLSNAA